MHESARTDRPRPSLIASRDVYHQGPAIRDHLAFMEARFDDGTVLVGGPLASGMAGMALLEVPDLEAAEAFARADPGVAGGVLAYDVEEVVTFFDALDTAAPVAPTGDLGGRPRGVADSDARPHGGEGTTCG